jgi:hypothetical protein
MLKNQSRFLKKTLLYVNNILEAMVKIWQIQLFFSSKYGHDFVSIFPKKLLKDFHPFFVTKWQFFSKNKMIFKTFS